MNPYTKISKKPFLYSVTSSYKDKFDRMENRLKRIKILYCDDPELVSLVDSALKED